MTCPSSSHYSTPLRPAQHPGSPCDTIGHDDRVSSALVKLVGADARLLRLP